jgi:hypothetical protein
LKRYSGIIIIILLAAIVFAPFDVPFTVESVAKVLPTRQWALLKRADGSLSLTHYDHRTGLVSHQEGYQFDRGDQVQVRFNDGWKAGSSVRAGEKVATIASNRLVEQLLQLKSELAVEQANLGVVATGQKPQLIRQLEEEINLARADLELRRKTLDRTRQLHSDGLVPLMELERAENAYNESMARAQVAEKKLAVNSTGEKQETVSLAASKIASLQKEIAFLENKQNKYVLTAPFDGQVRFETTPDGDRLLLEDTSVVILLIPVRLHDSRFVRPGQNVALHLVDNQTAITASVLEIGSRVEILNREQVVIVKAAAGGYGASLQPGSPVRSRIDCGKVRVAEFLKRSIRWQ